MRWDEVGGRWDEVGGWGRCGAGMGGVWAWMAAMPFRPTNQRLAGPRRESRRKTTVRVRERPPQMLLDMLCVSGLFTCVYICVYVYIYIYIYIYMSLSVVLVSMAF